jgi:predicted RNase H-like HicB family nuclease
MVTVQKKKFFRYSIVIRKEEMGFSSWCPELEVASSGNSVETASKNLKEAIDCLIATYTDLGELQQMLTQRGISLDKEDDSPSLFVSEARIGVPTTA